MVNAICQSINFDAPGIEKRYWGRVVGLALEKLNPKGLETPERRVSGHHLPSLCKETRQTLSLQEVKPLGFRNALILGLGVGTVAHLLAQRFPGARIDGVELDPVIIEVAKEFFNLEKIPNLNVICADAFDLVTSHTKYEIRDTRYDLILSDLYCGGRFPEKFSQPEFLHGVRDLLAPDGLAIFNRVIRQGHREELDDFIEKIRSIFVRVEEVEVPGPSGFSNLLITARG